MARGWLLLGLFCLSVTVMEASDNTTLRVTTIVSRPFLMLKDDDSGHGDRFEGYIVDLVRALSDKIAMGYNFHLVRDVKYGSKGPDGNWNGMVGEIIRKEADMAAAPLIITAMRQRVVDFSRPFMISGIAPAVAPVKVSKADISMVLKVFNYKVWILLIFSYVLVCMVLWLSNRYNPHEKSQNKDGPSTFNLPGSFWFGISTFTWQGYEQRPRSHAGRVLASFWFCFAVMTLLLFCAGLVHTFFTHHSHGKVTPFESISDLADDQSYAFGTVDGGSTKGFFLLSKNALYQRMWRRMASFVPSAFVGSSIEGYERARNSKYVYLGESHMIKYTIGNEPCGTLVTFGRTLDTKELGLAISLNSPLKGRLDVALLKLRETGYLQELETKWILGTCPPSSTKPDRNSWRDYRGIVVTEKVFAFPLIFLLVGVVLSVIVCIGEILQDRKKRSSSDKNPTEAI